MNKTDLPRLYDEDYFTNYFENSQIINSSMIKSIGIQELEDAIRTMFYDGHIAIDSDMIINNLRHKQQLELASGNMESVLKDLHTGVPLDCIEVDLRSCWENLGEITGESLDEDILDRIFSEFCIGK